MREKVWGKEAVNKNNSNEVGISGSTIFYYTGIDKPHVLEMNKYLHNLEVKHLAGACTLEIDPAPIRLRINSGGGMITAGVAGMDNIRTLKAPVYTIIDGFCASAATFLSVVGKKRFITENSFMLIHQLSTSFWGKYEEFEDEKKNLDLMMQMIKNVYNKYTNIPSKELDKILKRDLMLDAKKCLKWGLVDKII
jgi:ATP-dependent Clp endopeptidase proteolytic subunit ClpP